MGTTGKIQSENWDLLAKALFDKPAGESETLQEIASAIPDGTSEVEDVKRLAHQIDLHFKLKKYNTPRAWSRVKAKIRQQKAKAASRATLIKTFKVAAVVVLSITIGSVAYFMGQKQFSKTNISEVVVDDFGLSKIELSDGSVVTLNRDTKINYPDKFGDDIREISIEGEAFFEVTPNPNKPFVIHAGEATVKVLGTSFSVNAYPANDVVEVIVKTGKVQFSKTETNPNSNFNVILDPGEKGTYTNTSKALTKSINTDPNFLSWKTRELVFNETSLGEVIKQINKVYRVQVKTDLPVTDTLLLNARFERESLDFILEVISATHGLKVEKNAGNYLLKKET